MSSRWAVAASGCVRPLRTSPDIRVIRMLRSPPGLAQVALTSFEGISSGGGGLTVAALHAASLSLCCPDGSVTALALPEPYTALWAVPGGLLLDGAPHAAPCQLRHSLRVRRSSPPSPHPKPQVRQNVSQLARGSPPGSPLRESDQGGCGTSHRGRPQASLPSHGGAGCSGSRDAGAAFQAPLTPLPAAGRRNWSR